MSAFNVGGDIIHYEVLGRGRQVVFVHGWIGSWRYWTPTMQQLQARYRVYALDLYGFGDSSKNPLKYTLEHQIELLADFLRELGMPKAAFIGHGLGALVVAEFARRYPDSVPRLMLVSAPLFDPGDLDRRVPVQTGQLRSGTGPLQVGTGPLRQGTGPLRTGTGPLRAGTGPIRPGTGPLNRAPKPMAGSTAMSGSNPAMRAALVEASAERGEKDETVERQMVVLAPNSNPLMDILADGETMLARTFRRSEPEYGKLRHDVVKTDPLAIRYTSSMYDSGRMVDTLRLLDMPIAVIHGMDDPIIPPPPDSLWNYVTTGKEHLLMPIPLPGVRHFPMLEYDLFGRLLNDFLDAPDVSRLEIKERWRRRTR